MKTYECTVLIDASNGQTVSANSPEQAAEIAQELAAQEGAGSLCHYCSKYTDMGDIYGVVVYEGDKTVLDTTLGAGLGKRVDDLQSRLNAVEAENERMREALKFYADKEHFHFEGDDWDSVSGEPHNILWHSEEPYFVENGYIAKQALEGKA